MHLGTFPDSVIFHCWKVNFKTDVCPKSPDPHITMHRIKEVEQAKTIDEPMTSRSIVGRNDCTDYVFLFVLFASALKRLLYKHIHFRKREGVEEQRAQKIRPILTRETSCFT